MPQQPSQLVEITLVESNLRLRGTPLKLKRDSMTLQMNNIPDDEALLRPGTAAEIIVVARGDLFTGMSHILQRQGNELELRFVTPPSKIQRRQSSRFPCHLIVTYRADHGNRCFGPWRTVEAINISHGGLSLMVETNMALPRRLEMLLFLPESWETPAPVIGRVAHQKRNADGMTVLGVAFSSFSPVDQLRLHHYLRSLEKMLFDSAGRS